MSAEAVVFDSLANADAVTDLVDDRIFPLLAPHLTTLPYIQYRRQSTDPLIDLAGKISFDRAEIRVEFYAEEFGQLLTLSDAIRQAVDNYPATLFNSGHIKDDISGWHIYKVMVPYELN